MKYLVARSKFIISHLESHDMQLNTQQSQQLVHSTLDQKKNIQYENIPYTHQCSIKHNRIRMINDIKIFVEIIRIVKTLRTKIIIILIVN